MAYTSFTFVVKDNGGTANFGTDLDPTERTLTIDLLGVHNGPAGTSKTVTTLEEASYPFSVADFGFSDPGDNPADTLQAVKITTLPAGGTLKLNDGDVVEGQLVAVGDVSSMRFWPDDNGRGVGYATFTFQVQDDGLTTGGGSNLDPTPNTITIDVTPVNDAPDGMDDLLSAIAEDSGARRIPFSALTGNDSKGPANESGQALTIIAVGDGVGGTR